MKKKLLIILTIVILLIATFATLVLTKTIQFNTTYTKRTTVSLNNSKIQAVMGDDIKKTKVVVEKFYENFNAKKFGDIRENLYSDKMKETWSKKEAEVLIDLSYKFLGEFISYDLDNAFIKVIITPDGEKSCKLRVPSVFAEYENVELEMTLVPDKNGDLKILEYNFLI